MEETQENTALLILQTVTHQEIAGFVGIRGVLYSGQIRDGPSMKNNSQFF